MLSGGYLPISSTSERVREQVKPFLLGEKNMISESEQKRLDQRKHDNQYQKEYRHSKNGLINRIYGDQRSNSKKRGHEFPDYNLEELKRWIYSQPNFDDLYQAWAESGFDKKKTPSCDRLSDYHPYSLSNLRLTTWSINDARGRADRRNGINNKNSKAVLQLTREGIVIAEHHSGKHACRVTGIESERISACCLGKKETAGGFVWCFSE